jgi:hypothetical protein
MHPRASVPLRKPLEELAVDLLLESYGEHRYNRSPEEYERLCALIPPLKEACYRVNRRLKELHESGKLRERLICDFRGDDQRPRYRQYPISISSQTIRKGLVALGFRNPKWRKREA